MSYLGPELPLGSLQKPTKAKKEPKPIKPGKVSKEWIKTRNKWLKDHPADYFMCALCGDRVDRKEVTLDHIIPRSRAPHLRFEPSNLQPAHYLCNSKKGSKAL